MQENKFSSIQKIILYTIIFISAGYYIKYNIQGYVWREKIDFNAFYYASKSYSAGLNPYDHKNILKMKMLDNINDYSEDFPLPPFMLHFFKIFNLLYIRYAQLAWLMISNALFICAIYFIYKYICADFFNEREKKLYSLIFLFFSIHYYGPTVWENALGNINNILFFLIVAAFYFYKKKKFVVSGVSIGLACAVKIMPVVILPFFFFKKKWTVLISAFLVFFFLLTAPLITGDTQIYKNWYKDGLMNVYTSNARPFNQSIKGFYMRIFSANSFYSLKPHTIEKIIFLNVAVIGLFFLFTAYKKKENADDEDLVYSLFVIYILLASARAWETWFMYLILPFNLYFICLLKNTNEKFNRLSFFFFIAGFILVAVDYPYQHQRFLYGYKTFLTNLKLYGALSLTTAILLFRKK